MKSRLDRWMMLLAIAAAGTAQAQTRVGGNPLDSLPQINAPKTGPNVTVQVSRRRRNCRSCCRGT